MRKAERRKKIIEILSSSDSEISGEKMAELFGVTRQVIVQDIAILKSQGYDISSMSRGYLLNKHAQIEGIKMLIAVKHKKERIKEELECIVENGGKVLDVIVEHPVYGEITGNIGVESYDDVERFISRLETSKALPLLSLSDGVHLHTIQVKDKDDAQKIISVLKSKNFILE